MDLLLELLLGDPNRRRLFEEHVELLNIEERALKRNESLRCNVLVARHPVSQLQPANQPDSTIYRQPANQPASQHQIASQLAI